MKIRLLKCQLAGALCAVALFSMITSGCRDGNTSSSSGSNADSEKAATASAQTWLTLIDGGNYAQSWNDADAFFQKNVSEANWKSSMEQFRKPMGALMSRKLKSARSMTQLPGAPDGNYVVMQFNTSFANKRSAIETVTFTHQQDGTWKSSGYFIK